MCDWSELIAYLHVFVGGLLPFGSHGLWWTTSEHASEKEEGERNTDEEGRVPDNLPTFSGRSLSTRAVRTESNVVGCTDRYTSALIPPKKIPKHVQVPNNTAQGQTSRRAKRNPILFLPLMFKHVPAFFSANVNSVQSVFMRSLNAIQRSACS